MSHYSNEPRSVRVDFFRESGKWAYTEAMLWVGEWSDVALIHDEFLVSLVKHCFIKKSGLELKFRMTGMTVVCLEPYHEHVHPLMIINWTRAIEQKHMRLIV